MAKHSLKSILRPQQAELQLKHPVYGDTEAVVYLVGTLSKQFKDAQLKVRKSLGADLDLEKLELEQQAKLLASVYVECVVGWNDELAEAIGPFSPETALTLFTDPEIDWIGGQIALFINDTANFFRPKPAELGEMGSASNI